MSRPVWLMGYLFIAAVVLGCSDNGVRPQSATPVVKEPADSADIAMGKATGVFRRVSPQKYGIDYPDFLLLETEVTNRMFHEYLLATGQRKADNEVGKLQKPPVVSSVEVTDGKVDEKGWKEVGGGTVTGFQGSSGDMDFQIASEKGLWRGNTYPAGLEDHPVALVSVLETILFCKWLSQTHPDRGLFRLPTWNEWMIAAYGKSRAYPWGDQWDPSFVLTSHETVVGESRTQTEPVKARPRGRSPEGLYGLLGNVSEYLIEDDPTGEEYFNLGARWMGGGFTDGETLLPNKTVEPSPREDYWGYSHGTDLRVDDLGFRVLLDPRKDRGLMRRPRLFQQENNAWRTKSE